MRQHPLGAIPGAVVAPISHEERIERVARHPALRVFGRDRTGFTAMTRLAGSPVAAKRLFLEETATGQQVRRIARGFFAVRAGRQTPAREDGNQAGQDGDDEAPAASD